MSPASLSSKSMSRTWFGLFNIRWTVWLIMANGIRAFRTTLFPSNAEHDLGDQSTETWAPALSFQPAPVYPDVSHKAKKARQPAGRCSCGTDSSFRVAVTTATSFRLTPAWTEINDQSIVSRRELRNVNVRRGNERLKSLADPEAGPHRVSYVLAEPRGLV